MSNFASQMNDSLSPNPNKSIIYWLLSGCALVYCMVVVGCITRLTHSGLSITDWNFMGSLPPFSEQDWMARFAKYQTSPEFMYKNSSMTMEEFKSIFWWEYIHRSIGNTMMFVFLVGFVWFLVKKKFTKQLLPKMLFLFGLGALQGLIGWWMVKSGLVKNPNVSHFRLAIHLMSAFSVFAFTFWFALQLIFKDAQPASAESAKLKPVAILLFITVVIQVIFGAFVAGLKAGLYYPTWPKMGDDWFPEDTILVSDSFVHNFFENGAGVQFVHRTFAFVVVACVAWLWFRAAKLKLNAEQNKAVTLLIYGVTIQFMLGIFTLLYQVPIVLGVLHQTGAFFLFAVSIYLLFHLYNKPSERHA